MFEIRLSGKLVQLGNRTAGNPDATKRFNNAFNSSFTDPFLDDKINFGPLIDTVCHCQVTGVLR